jgi:hypothetical protein
MILVPPPTASPMRRLLRQFAVLAITLGMAGCFTSREPLIGPEDAVFPFDRIVFGEVSRPNDRQSLVRKGDAYSFRPDDSEEREAFLRLKAVGENLYVVEMAFTEDDQVQRLHAVLKADPAAMRVYSFAAIRPDAFVAEPGLSVCGNMACIDDLDAYVAYAIRRIEAGVPADAVYRLIALE